MALADIIAVQVGAYRIIQRSVDDGSQRVQNDTVIYIGSMMAQGRYRCSGGIGSIIALVLMF